MTLNVDLFLSDLKQALRKKDWKCISAIIDSLEEYRLLEENGENGSSNEELDMDEGDEGEQE